MLDAIQSFDASILMYIQEHLRCAFLNGFLSFITQLGNAGFIWILLGIALLIPEKTRRGGFDMLLCLVFAFVVNDLIIKPSVVRERPFTTLQELEILIKEPSSYSFPSGHANSSFASAYALTRAFGKKGAWSYVLAALIAFSRCYVGVHYPSDILAGMAVGTICSALAYYLSKRFIHTDLKRRRN